MSVKKEDYNIFKQAAWTFRCKKENIFSAPDDYSLAHCVGSDLQMGAGIAIEFRRKFGNVSNLRRQSAKTGEVAVLKCGKRYIYYLVTKKMSTQKPKINDLLESLIAMRLHMRANGVTKIAIPKIGCGLDRLNWKDVFDVIERVFSKEPIEMVLYDIKA